MLSKKEQKALISGDDFSIPERIKYTLSGSYKVFGLPPPDFGTTDWINAQEGLDWRNDLIHPKTPGDLEISSDSWNRIDSGLIWLLKQHFNFIQHLHEWNTKAQPSDSNVVNFVGQAGIKENIAQQYQTVIKPLLLPLQAPYSTNRDSALSQVKLRPTVIIRG